MRALTAVPDPGIAPAASEDQPFWSRLGLDDPAGDRDYQRLSDAFDAEPELGTWALARWEQRRRVLTLTDDDPAMLCAVPDCPLPYHKGRLCIDHYKQCEDAGGHVDPVAWAATCSGLPSGKHRTEPEDCTHERDGVRCQRPRDSRSSGLCASHDHIRRDRPEMLAASAPHPDPGPCRVGACDWKAMRGHEHGGREPMCAYHTGKWARAVKAGEFAESDWANWQRLHGPPEHLWDYRQMWLGELPGLVVLEILWCAGARRPGEAPLDVRGFRYALDVVRWKRAVSWRSVPVDEGTNGWSRKMLRVWTNKLDLTLSDPDAEWDRDIIRSKVIDPSDPQDNRLDLSGVRQPWLRDQLIDVLKATWQSTSLRHRRNMVTHARLLSEALSVRSDAGADPAVLGTRDIDAVVRHIAQVGPTATATRTKLTQLRVFLAACDQHSTVRWRPGFQIQGRHMPYALSAQVAPGERALPDATFSLLCGVDHIFGARVFDVLRAIPRDNPAAPGLVGETCVQIVNYSANWGRRPHELVELCADRVRLTDSGAGQLKYTNFKSGRENVWLPIDARQATDMLAWKGTLRGRFQDTPDDELKLFPGSLTNPDGRKAVTVNTFGVWFRKWTYALERLIVAAKLAQAVGWPVGEVLALRASDIAVTDTGARIGGCHIALDAGAKLGLGDYLADLRAVSDVDDPPAFPDLTHMRVAEGVGPMSGRFVQSVGDDWERLACQYATWGLPGEHLGRQRIRARDVEWRRFRHTYLQHLVDAGTDIFVVQELADHADVGTTIGAYVRTRIEQLTEAVERLSDYRINRFGARRTADSLPLAGRTDVVTNTCENPQVHGFNREGCDRGELCYGCEFFSLDPSHLPDLKAKVLTLRKSVQRFEDEGNDLRAQVAREDLAGWKETLERMEGVLAGLPAAERDQVEEAARVVRAYRTNQRAGNLPMGSITDGGTA